MLKDKYVLNQVYTTGLSNVNTIIIIIIIIIRLISYKSNLFGFKYFSMNTKDKQTRLSLARRSLSSTVDSKTDESVGARGLRGQCNKTQGQFNRFDSAGILQ